MRKDINHISALRNIRGTTILLLALIFQGSCAMAESVCNSKEILLPVGNDVIALEKAARTGDSHAQVVVGLAYWRRGDKKSLSKGLDWIGRGAASGNADAELLLGQYYLANAKSAKDLQMAVSVLKQASGQGCIPADFYLGNLAVQGKVGGNSREEGFSMMKKAAESGYVPAQLWISGLLIAGVNVPKDVDEGFRWALRAAESGNSVAKINLANLYFSGIGTKADPVKAIDLLKAVYEKNDQQAATAAYYLGWVYMEGKRLPVDNDEARHWMSIAAKSHVMDAEQRLEALNSGK